MTHVKCEAIHSMAKIEFKDNLKGLDERPMSTDWPKGEIPYRLNNHTKDIKKNRLQDRALTVALRAWQLRISDLKFRRERNPDVSVDFDVSFEPLKHFNGKKGVFAHGFYSGQGKISGDVHINDEWNWTTHSKLQRLSTPPLVPILIHEFGHSLNLTHDTNDVGSIMYPSFNLGMKKNRLGPRDIIRIQSRYGVRTISQRMIDYFINRRDRGFDFR